MRPLSLLLAVVLLAGCASIGVTTTDGEKKTVARVHVPAWPWQNSQQIVERFTLGVKTNGMTLSMRTVQSETGDTNFWAGIGTLVGTALKTAAKP